MDIRQFGWFEGIYLNTRKSRWLQRIGALGGGLLFIGAQKIIRRITRRSYFKNKVVLITGGSRGLGLILAKKFLLEGAHLILCSRSEDNLKRAKKILNPFGKSVFTLVCDVSNRTQVEEMAKKVEGRFGRLDVLVNSAGIIQVGPAQTLEHKDYEEAMNIIFWGTVNTTLAILPLMRRQKAGHIANVTSIGSEVAVPHLLPYTVGKFAMRGFSEGLGSELKQEGIYVTTIIPGLMRTGSFVHALFKSNRDKEFRWFSFGSKLPLLSMNAERAADQMLEAIRNRKSWVIVGVPAKLLYRFYTLFTKSTLLTLSWVNRLALPESNMKEKEFKEGLDFEKKKERRQKVQLGRRPIKKYNQAYGAESHLSK